MIDSVHLSSYEMVSSLMRVVRERIFILTILGLLIFRKSSDIKNLLQSDFI